MHSIVRAGFLRELVSRCPDGPTAVQAFVGFRYGINSLRLPGLTSRQAHAISTGDVRMGSDHLLMLAEYPDVLLAV